MKICAIITSFTSGGAEILVKGLAEEFSDRGHEVLVVALADAETVGNSSATESRMREELTRYGVQCESLKLSPSRNPFQARAAMRKLLAGFQPDVVHAHTVRALPLLAMAGSKAKVVLTHHNTKINFHPVFFRVFDRLTDIYIAIGSDVHKILSRHVGKPIVSIPNAAGRNFSGSGARRNPPSQVPRILTVGAISEQKNYALLIEVAKACQDLFAVEHMPAFSVVGGGQALNDFRARVEMEGLSSFVSFVGERSDVPELMRGSDLYLNTSLYEGMPLTLLEAMAMGLPIIASDVPGNRELVINDHNGFRASLNEPKSFAEIIKSVMSDANLYARLSRNSAAKSHDYSIDAAAEKHLDLYRGLTRLAA